MSLKFTDSVLLDIQHQVSPLKRDLRSDKHPASARKKQRSQT
ncbi:hypothetical protein D1BOALGB6SA_9124 [Olavius sp. associated proteobacterium Delta 1]|nr:hypothetical protein D1BOALGB6SA_9124 [Olavius sp. associated proteobacterium Delta 1]